MSQFMTMQRLLCAPKFAAASFQPAVAAVFMQVHQVSLVKQACGSQQS
jgi:hypothetical protein